VRDGDAAKERLAAIARDRTLMKTAAVHDEEVARFHGSEGETPGTAFVGIGLSHAGYDALGRAGQAPRGEAFERGMPSRRDLLCDPGSLDWEEGYRDPPDVIVLVGSHSAEETSGAASRVCDALRGAFEVVTRERGLAQTNSDGNGIEHFGYVDGRSQPLYTDEDRTAERGPRGGTSVWNPARPTTDVLVPEPPDGAHHGSFLVYRKLEQNVQAFKQQEERVADELELEGEEEERAGGLLVGRFEDGTPLALQSAEGMHQPVPNNFDFRGDDTGARCPLTAHIRRMNGRLDGAQLMARRGQTYGVRVDNPNDDNVASKPTGGVGLLFMAVMRSIEDQFEALQRAANDIDRFDPVVGQLPDDVRHASIELPATWGDPDQVRRQVDIEPTVTMKGGEYFFLPSISFLQSLGEDAGV
jgi:Dyp-type peroxidase family